MKDEVIYEFIPELLNEKVPEQELQMGAVDFLIKQHREAQSLLRRALKTEDKRQLPQLANQICQALTIHAKLEEELVYPLMREEDAEEEILSATQHDLQKKLIKEIESMKASDVGFLAKLKVLNVVTNDHIKEEETKALPEFVRSGVADMQELGRQLAERNQKLQMQMQMQMQKKTTARKSSRAKTTRSKTSRSRSRSKK